MSPNSTSNVDDEKKVLATTETATGNLKLKPDPPPDNSVDVLDNSYRGKEIPVVDDTPQEEKDEELVDLDLFVKWSRIYTVTASNPETHSNTTGKVSEDKHTSLEIEPDSDAKNIYKVDKVIVTNPETHNNTTEKANEGNHTSIELELVRDAENPALNNQHKSEEKSFNNSAPSTTDSSESKP